MPRPVAILIVEDNRDRTDSLALLFRTTGYDLRSTDSAVEAEQGVHDGFRPDVVFIDLALAQEDGITLARRLRDLLPRRPVIATLTGFPTLHEKARETEFDFHFLKPVDVATLLRLIDISTRPGRVSDAG
jgi:CheY-like chemotaxis protein